MNDIETLRKLRDERHNAICESHKEDRFEPCRTPEQIDTLRAQAARGKESEE